ncbi:DUF951 domain-containing protein [Agrilactobacillus fermenti]|uniref:DUF951 domain-containing protein n=1 Tax=Agrilactobacillus fermenti TaxID=2586909 RepID=UPI001E2BBBF8|nr:DUF951 domain-containing protein [Agrilactobacillus fermenti]MCD2255500.1 DUF951 domain-containing protein [Agrilactobacillus fermenti]
MFALGDIVMMKKQHACGTNRFEIIRMGMDIRIKCLGCGHLVMMPRKEFQKKMKSILVKADAVTADEVNYQDVLHRPRPDELL